MQREDWRQIYEEVEREVHGLIVEQQGQIEKAFALNNGKLDVTFKVTLEEKDSTFDVSVDISSVKEKIKSGDSKRLILGQIDLPGFTAKQGRPMTDADIRRPPFDESRMLGAGSPQLEAGEPLHMGAGEGAGGRSCKTCRFGLIDGCDNNDATFENCSAPSFDLYEEDPGAFEAAEERRVSGRKRTRGAACNVGSRQHSDSPFYCGDGMEYCDVENRLMRVKEMGLEKLRAVIALPGCQKQVVKAAERRLKKLEKETRKNCGSRDGEYGCGLEEKSCTEPCASRSQRAAVA